MKVNWAKATLDNVLSVIPEAVTSYVVPGTSAAPGVMNASIPFSAAMTLDSTMPSGPFSTTVLSLTLCGRMGLENRIEIKESIAMPSARSSGEVALTSVIALSGGSKDAGSTTVEIVLDSGSKTLPKAIVCP